MTITSKIGEVARQQGYNNIKEFADKAGIAYNTAHDLYMGHFTRIGFEVLDKVCRLLKMQPGDLLIWEDK